MQINEARSSDRPSVMIYHSEKDNTQRIEEFSIPENEEDISWIHITPSTKTELSKVIDMLDIHPLAADAICSFSESPRMDVYRNHMYVSTFVIKEDYSTVRISILLGGNYVITHEEKNDLEIFPTLMEDFDDHPSHMSSPGHILYHLLDHISKFYLEAMDKISDEIHSIEKTVFKFPFANEIGHHVYNWKGKIHILRQIVEAQESVIKEIGQADRKYINEESGIYLKSLEQNFERVVSALDTFVETLSGIFDLQMSLKSDHMNSIMKTLTLVSVVFIPMTFIAGLYGMNFEKMPELGWEYGYVYSLVLMFGLGVSIALFFRKKGWWGQQQHKNSENSRFPVKNKRHM